MITAGVDLATEPSKTAQAIIEWDERRADIVELRLGVTDDDIVSTAGRADKLGLDCPLGWPDAFVRFAVEHQAGRLDPSAGAGGLSWRRELAYRDTDRAVLESVALQPLSVAADRIGLTAMRAAVVLARLAQAGHPVDRVGSGVVIEVYPAASLKCWGLPHRGYKQANGLAVRAILVRRLAAAAPWLNWGKFEALCVESDDALDAVVASLTARAAALGSTSLPDSEGLSAARREGWIALPLGGLSALLCQT